MWYNNLIPNGRFFWRKNTDPDKERKLFEVCILDGIVVKGKPVNPTIAVGSRVNVWNTEDERRGNGVLSLGQVSTFRVVSIADRNEGTEGSMVLLRDDGGDSMYVPLEELMRIGTYGGERFQIVQEYST